MLRLAIDSFRTSAQILEYKNQYIRGGPFFTGA
jgi:hypothetical protein